MASKDSIIQVIEARKSVRSFSDRSPDAGVLRRCAGGSAFLRVLDADVLGSGRVGSYGVITGRPSYVAVVCRESDLLQAGIDGERMVLALTAEGLGTCWLGGTFNRGRVAAALGDMAEGESCVAVIAVGYARDRRGLVDRMMRAVVHADSRMCVSDFIIAGAAPPYLTDTLEAVRLAPSAANRQPWRFAFNPSGTVDVYGVRKDSFMMLDVCIALAHFLAVSPGYSVGPNTHVHPLLEAIVTLTPV